MLVEIFSKSIMWGSVAAAWWFGEEQIFRQTGQYEWPEENPLDSVIFLESGSVLTEIDGQMQPVSAPAAVLIGGYTRCRWENPEPYTGAWIQLQVTYTGMRFNAFFHTPVIVTGKEALRIGADIRRMLKSSSPSTNDVCSQFCLDLSQQAVLLNMLEIFARAAVPKTNMLGISNTKLVNLLTGIGEHLDEAWGTAKMAEKCCMSESAFYRYFKEMTGKTPLKYVMEKRMEVAGVLLMQGRSVSQTAEAVGYEDVGYFDRLFLRRYRCTPLAYRRMVASQFHMKDENDNNL